MDGIATSSYSISFSLEEFATYITESDCCWE